MAKVFLTSATCSEDKHGRLELGYLQDSVQRDPFGAHEVTNDPAAADLILFAEREHAAGDLLEKVRRHSCMRQFREKCFVFDPRYKDVPLVPGVYASIPKAWHNSKRTRGGHYPEVVEDQCFSYDPEYGEAPYLYSYVGKRTHPIRERASMLTHARGLFRDTSDADIELRKVNEWGEEEASYIRRYVETTKRSKFVLCPRGAGPSTMRLFETLLLGRVPVIISDQWVPPHGPDWQSFSIHVPEQNVAGIPNLLEQREGEAEAMGRRARRAWEQWFSREVSFHRIVEWCMGIQKERSLPEAMGARMAYTHLLRPSRLYWKYKPVLAKTIRKFRRRFPL